MKNLILIIILLIIFNSFNFAQRCDTIETFNQILTSTCDSNSRLEIEVKGLRYVDSVINVPLGNNVKQIIAEALCRNFETRDGSTCPASIVYTINGKDVSVPGIPLNYCSSWIPYGRLEEGFFYVYRLNESKPVTSIQYNPPALDTDRNGMRGLTTWIVHEDIANANSPNGLNFDYFLFQEEEKCGDVLIAPSNSLRDITVYLPVFEIDYNLARHTRYRAEALDVNGKIVASLPHQLFNDDNIAPEIRLDKFLFNNVPENAVKLKICIESPLDSNAKGPSFMVSSVMATSSECAALCTDDSQFQTNYSGCVENVATYQNGNYILKNDNATIYDYSSCTDYTNLQNCIPVIGLDNLAANDALWAATKTAEYFSGVYNINIPPVDIIVNYDKEPNKAAYKPNNNIIILGKGDGEKRKSMTAPDIVAHEVVHHLIAFISNNEFGIFGETGALNESFADIFAEVIEARIKGNNDWIFGKDVTINGMGIRSFKDPNSFNHPDTYKGENWIDENVCFYADDNCGVHVNNNVHNYWFYLLTQGGSGTNDNNFKYDITGIGMEHTEKIVLKSLLTYLEPDAAYSDAKNGAIMAAIELFGSNSFALKQTESAWDAIGCNNSAFKDVNYIQFSTAEYDDTLINNNTVQMEFDLLIDSLSQDISAENLQITFNTNGQFENLEVITVYSPLVVEDITISQSSNNTTIKIERDSEQFSKIKSGDPIFRMISCIVEDDIPADTTSIKPIDISGFSSTNNGLVNFNDHSLVFFDPYNRGSDPNFLPANITIEHQNCNSLGLVHISILPKVGDAPFTYSIINEAISYIKDVENYTIYNLEQGIYQLKVQDKNGKVGLYDLLIKFNATFDGSLNCVNDSCPSLLSINYNNISGVFKAQKEIEIKGSIEKDIKDDVIFSICK